MGDVSLTLEGINATPLGGKDPGLNYDTQRDTSAFRLRNLSASHVRQGQR
jgi:hypothetical protein